ncbi:MULTISPECIES: Arm DNA-binding domain-containing protein [unclassified Francisella]|uniref:Arm DNA-binding domain-containing protein n=1 Tax=unclassified Francisella TaxID=2610885 RepID=UPI002E36AC5F|nr:MULTISPECIES: Arm DNA-binding domain-containing protein [unclassified Francisella]MED7820137.1 Arm DNA-binding domain-containing protein [Francisella sp. 19S2-4]MED7830957.1 Arm DNA-binding domain-containing protein [Francisella sp. 19S2-10]
MPLKPFNPCFECTLWCTFIDTITSQCTTMAKLSKQFIEKSKEVKELKDKEKRYSDDNCTNLWFIARSSGVHSWLYRFKLNKKADSFTIGKYQDISLAEARELARNYNKILES